MTLLNAKKLDDKRIQVEVDVSTLPDEFHKDAQFWVDVLNKSVRNAKNSGKTKKILFVTTNKSIEMDDIKKINDIQDKYCD